MTRAATPKDIVDFFLDPASYDHDVARVEHGQTHVSHLFFAGDYVYKVKKPVNLGFLDFSTLEKRRAAAIAEIELNRRVSPQVYIDLAAVHRDVDGHLSFSAPAMVAEVAVVMRRLPDRQRFSKLIETGTASAEMSRTLGKLIADFHARAETSRRIAEYGSMATIRHNWDENFEQTEAYIGRTLSRTTWETCKAEIERFVRTYADLFQKRADGGWIRDCHGDLQADDIFIDPDTGSAQVLDCIEFNDRFRYSDTISDIAFLSMDLRNRGRDDLAKAFLDAYYDRSNDERITSLLRFYESYRAYVRGKVRSFLLDQDEPSDNERAAATRDAQRFFEQSFETVRRLRPRLILVCGLMGSGKTKQAKELARRAGTRVVHSDVTRKKLAGLDPEQERHVAFGTDIYSDEWSERTYRTLVNEARDELARGNSIVLDASWSKAKYRELARAVAAQREALFGILECRAPESVLRSRLSKPGRHITDGRVELLDDQRAAYEAPSAEEAELMVQIETAGDFDRVSTRAYETLFT